MNALLVLSLFLLVYPLAVYPPVLALLSRRARPAFSRRFAPDTSSCAASAQAASSAKTVTSMEAAPSVEFTACGDSTASAEAWPPTVSVLLSVYNEEAALPGKLENFLTLDHPPERLELIVVSDGSTDGTDNLVRNFAAGRVFPPVRLLRQEGRLGKTSALNLAAGTAKGEILLFTDADALFAPDCLHLLLEPFRDPAVGLAGGRSLYLEAGGGESGAGLYRRFEEWLKEREGRLFGIAGADGAIYALRRELYAPLAPEYINDLVHPVQVALAGKKSVAVPKALIREPAPESGNGSESARQTRIMAQSWLIFFRHWRALIRAGRWGFLWQFVSHKVLRWLALPFMVLSLVAALAEQGVLSTLTLGGFVVFGALALCGKRGGAGRPGRLARMFWVQSAAAMRGLRLLLRGDRFVVWAPRGGQT